MSGFPGDLSTGTNRIETSDLRTQTGSSTGGLRHAAGEFESLLLSQWLHAAESTFGSVPGGDGDEDAGDAQMKDFAIQALARGFTAAGGIGLSAMVERNLAKAEQGSGGTQHNSPLE